MADQLWYTEHGDGTPEQGPWSHQPYANSLPVDRLGDLRFERYDARRGWYKIGAAAEHAAIDDAHEADHGRWRRQIDYAIKEIEARILLGTLETDGRVAREAATRGIPTIDLAKQIVEAADDSNVEHKRIEAKVMASKGE